MNTPTHLLLSVAGFARPGAAMRNRAVIAGALLPDLPVYLLFLGATLSGVPQRVIWDELYFTADFQSVDAIANSVFVYGAAGALGWALGIASAAFLALSALLHLLVDFLTHHSDAHAHFWPLSDWRFESPVSYWEPGRHAGMMMPIEASLAIGSIALLWARFRGRLFKAALASLAALYLLGIAAMLALMAG